MGAARRLLDGLAPWGLFCRDYLERLLDGKLTGKVVGDVVDGEAKAAHLERVRDELGLKPEQVIAAGDGANDIPMLRAAGFGVAFHAKPVLRDVAHCCLDHSGLDGILDLFGA